MDLADLITGLSRPEAYPRPVAEVAVVQTHISVVFLAGDRAYKIKKPVDLGFLDFTTLALRRHYCEEEVRLNSRAAPDVYLGVVPVTTEHGQAVFGGNGEAIEYAVEMRRLPPDRTLAAQLEAGTLDAATVERLGERIAAFHRAAESGAHLAEWGAWPTVARNVRENFEQLAPYVGRSVSDRVLERLVGDSEAALASLRDVIDGRARAGRTCDTHGDLHLQHVYSFPERAAPHDFVLVDCIEFNERFRYSDPVADLAFLVMDLRYRGRADLAERLADSYFAAAADPEGRSLLPFYTAYRAVVRGKVESFVLDQPTVGGDAKLRALDRARPYMLLALGELAPVHDRPCLVLSTGLPGTGKSRLARGLVDRAGFARVSTDLERKRMAGVPAGQESTVRLPDALYAPESGRRTYEACLARATELLFEGRRVVVDGTFRERAWRRRFVDLARRWCVPTLVIVCDASPETVRARLAARTAEATDASDATWRVYELLAPRWEAPGPDEMENAVILDTLPPPMDVLNRALSVLADWGLW